MNSQKYKIRFFLEYGSFSPLWSDDDFMRERFGYEIDLEDLNLSNDVIELSKYMSDVHYYYLNPIYQPLPSFWSAEMYVFFQNKVQILFDRIKIELNDKYEISNECYFYYLTNDEILDFKTRLNLYLENPYKHYKENGILSGSSEQEEFKMIRIVYEKWIEIEQNILQGKSFDKQINLFELYKSVFRDTVMTAKKEDYAISKKSMVTIPCLSAVIMEF